MRVLFVTAEIHPLVRTGGLADVSAALPAALAGLGADARVIVLGYPQVLDRAVVTDHAVPLGDLPGAGPVQLIPARSPTGGVPLWLVDCPPLYRRSGGPYQGSDGQNWPDNDVRFATLSHAAARICRGVAGLAWRPDIVHANDWHAGLVPLLLHKHTGPRAASLFTIHNLAFQGLCDAQRLAHLGLPADSFTPDGIEFHGRISFLKAGIRYADGLTTVSRRYAHEVRTPEFGCGLDGLLRARGAHLIGIPNGADYATWDPANGLSLTRRYDAPDIGGKRICKEVLQRELGLAVEPATPIIAVLSRLTDQKMADTIAEAVPQIVRLGAQIVVHGEGDRALEQQFLAAAGRQPSHVAARIGYDDDVARRLLAGADILLHPSRFEPFGLVPLYAMRYGTVPVARSVGGLADNIADHSVVGDGDATGFLFSGTSLEDMLSCLARAIDVFRLPVSWRRLQRNAMRRDFSWVASAQAYLDLYRALAGASADDGSEGAEVRGTESREDAPAPSGWRCWRSVNV